MSFTLIVIILVLALFAPHIFGPIAVYRKSRTPRNREFYTLTPDEIASCTAANFSQRSEAIAALGFTHMENLQSIEATSKIFTTVFHNFSTLEMANISEITSFRSKGPHVRFHLIEFTSAFDDNTEINTNNGGQPRIFRHLPEKLTRSLPTIETVGDLYTIHRTFTNGITAPKKPLPASGTIAQEYEMEWADTFHRQADAGYYHFDPSTSIFRPTVKGAVIMSWKLIWPVGALRSWNLQRESRQLSRTILGR